MSVFESILLAIIEGVTEFLPVSSTGHIIIGSSLMGIADDPFTKMFTVAIQLGAIFSVVVLYWKRFFQSFDFYLKILVGFIPAVIFGLLLKDTIEALLERVDVVGYMLLAGGIFFLFLDRIFKAEDQRGQDVTYGNAFKIGLFQVVAMVPGVSRSAATIIGGLSQKLTKKTAAEFSFFLAVPTMFGATALSMFQFYRDGGSFGQHEIALLAIGNVVAFLVAMAAIKSFIAFLTRHGFMLFGIYRIAAGSLILILYYLGIQLSVL